MRTEKQAVARVLKLWKVKSNAEPFISNEDLIGAEPKNELERAGISVKAKAMRDAIEEELENVHGLGLVPMDYDGMWRIVHVNERAAHLIILRLEKVVRMLVSTKKVQSTLSYTIENYQTNQHISQEMEEDLAAAHRAVTAIEVVAEEALLPKLERMRDRIITYKAEDDAAGEVE